MKAFASLLSAALLGLCPLAMAQGLAAPDADVRLAQVIRTPHVTREKTVGGRHLGPPGVRSTFWTPGTKSKQDIADEKRLQHDLHICDGC